MIFTPALIEELEILGRYDVSTTFSGIKVRHDANAITVAATARLFHKGLVTQIDGGYLTPLGMEVAEHMQNMLTIINSVPA